MTGGTIRRVTIDPNLGGCTLVEGGSAPAVLAAGYVGSTLLGGAFVLAGWDTLVAKVCSFVLGVGLLCPLVLVRDKLCVPGWGDTWGGADGRAARYCLRFCMRRSWLASGLRTMGEQAR
jgi:hypothetical protein